MSKKRFSSLDLLKALSMLGVIILHYVGYIGHGAKLAEGTNNIYICSVVVGLSTYATDTFMIISGFLLAQRKTISISKAFSLLLLNFVVRICIYSIDILTNQYVFSTGGLIRCVLGTSYFITLYIVVYILSPFINLGISKLSSKGRDYLIKMVFILFSICPMIMTIIQNLIHIDISNWSTLGAYGNQDGYSITVFVLMYIIGAVVRMENKNDVSIFRYIIGFIICVAFNSFIFFVQNKYQFVPALNGYFNPFTVMGSFCLLKIFSSLEIKTDWICKTLKWFAEGSLMVLLASGKFIEKLNVEKYATGGGV